MIRVITFGTFDLLHQGHLNILHRAKALGDYLSVGVSSDSLNFSKKGKYPSIPESTRLDLIREFRCVDNVFIEESLELKRHYVEECNADVLVMGDDWAGKFDFLRDICKVVYLPRTLGISTTEIKNSICESK